jgi:hypothetical protein
VRVPTPEDSKNINAASSFTRARFFSYNLPHSSVFLDNSHTIKAIMHFINPWTIE